MKGTLPKYLLLLTDLAAIILSFRVAYFLRYESGLFPRVAEALQLPFSGYSYAIFFCLGAWLFLFLLYGANQFPAAGESSVGVAKLVTSCVFLVASLLAGMYLARVFYSRLLFFFLSILVVFFLVLTRLLYQFCLKRLRKYGIGVRRVVIVGQSDLAAELAERIERHLDLHYAFSGFLTPASSRAHNNGVSKRLDREPVVHGSEAMAQELAVRKVDELIFAIPIRRETETLEFIAHCQRRGITIKSVPEYYDLHTSQIESFSIDGIPLFELKDTALPAPQAMMKRVVDLLAVFLMLPLIIPACAIITVILYLGSRKVLQRQPRIGKGSTPFFLYRFDVNLPSEGHRSAPWQERLAGFLVRYSFSELPQIWNVLKGDMSLVGPQPESPERVRHYSAWHKRRLQLKPGITGLAQVKGLRETDSVDLKTKYDLEYAANYSPLVDLALVLATFNTLLARRKASGPGPSLPSWMTTQAPRVPLT